MTVQTMESSTLLFFSAAELKAEAIAPDQLTCDQALSLVQRSFRLAELPLPQETDLEIETFPAPHGILLFVRPRPFLTPHFPLNSAVLS